MRSLLFVPGDSPKKMEKALGSGADVLILDLEDSVATAAKAEAREVTYRFLRETLEVAERPALFVRINALDSGLCDADIDAVIGGRPEAILLPKSRDGRDITLLDAKLTAREPFHEIEDGTIGIYAIATETAQAVFNLGSYRAVSDRLSGLSWGAEDLSADLGAEANRHADGSYRDPYRLARTLCLFGAVAAEVAPIDTVHTAFRDLDALRRECEEARIDGFTAKLAIHPAQVPVINEVFTPSAVEIARAEAIVAAFADAGDAGVIGLDGEMLDRPHLKRAERLLARARLSQRG
ncbi:MAG: CoA ester lyase [Hyphomicrobiales bacterium]|nr:CoA ester lyase [Hyphomicrobiales bacterium]